MQPHRVEPFINAEQIQKRVAELAQQINRDYAGKSLVIIALINGAIPFVADLIRRLDLPGLRVDTLRASSYGNTTESGGSVKILSHFRLDLENEQVLVVDDILDTGRTMSKVTRLFDSENPASLKTCVLLDKPSRRAVPFTADYVGFEIEDKFVVGYGLDYAERYRQLPYIGVVKFEDLVTPII